MIARALATTLLFTLALAANALASPGYSLTLSTQSEAVVGRPMVIQVSGTIPPDEVAYLQWFSAGVIPTSFMATCPDDHWVGYQIANTTGGVLVFTQRETPDIAGNFSFPVAFTPWAPGQYVICGYSDDGYTNTLAVGSLVVDVRPGAAAPAGGGSPSPAPAGAPTNAEKPRVKRAGRKLVCAPGEWAGEPTAYAYRWLVGGKAGKRGRTLPVARARKRKVRCSVTASNATGSATAVSRPLRLG